MYETVPQLLRAVNKQRFIDKRTEQITEQQKDKEADASVLAEVEYQNFLGAGCFDNNGFLKPIGSNK